MKKWIVLILFIFTINLILDDGAEKILAANYRALEFPVNPDEFLDEPDGAINIIDPNTNEVIQSFTPNHFELMTDFNSYKTEVEQWVKELAWGSAAMGGGYNKGMSLDRIDSNGEVVKGKPSITVRENELVNQILEKSFDGDNIKIPLAIRESGYRSEDVKHFNEVVLASYSTYFNSTKIGRSKNIELSSAAIHNVIVGSEDFFSFNMTVGPREVATGYQLAPEIIKGKTVMGIGGGICQTSSTLFNAIDKLGVEIVERHHHSKDVGYVQKGRDATVSFGGLDFIFRNTTGVPFIIKSYYQPGTLNIQIRTTKEYADLLKNELQNISE
ncbi:VanW family protein [Ureibacillus sp. NPDC094379]